VDRRTADDDGPAVLLGLTDAGATATARLSEAGRERSPALLDRVPEQERAGVVGSSPPLHDWFDAQAGDHGSHAGVG
jgi:hypothetical protein